MVKNTPASAGDIRDVGSITGSGRFPWRRKWQPTPVFFAPMAGYSLWGLKVSDTTEVT